ncbi:MAG TPA: nitroreductase family protein [Kofleriaceae bacterium]
MTPESVLRNAVAAAVMAPSSHNTQPWRFRISGATLDLLADGSRQLRIIDRERRQLVHSCGCALYNARVAIRAMGFEDEVTVMFVDNEIPEHLASIHLGGLHLPTQDDRRLMAAVGIRATNRRAFLPRPIPEAIIDELAEAAAAEGASLVRLNPTQKAGLSSLIEAADQAQFADDDFRNELSRWLVPNGSRRRDGIPFVEKEYGSAMPFALVRALRSPALGETFGMLEETLVQGAPAVIVLGTDSDDVSSWLACGQALEAVLLHATAHGLSASFLNQVLEVPALRLQVAELVPGVNHPQMVLRIGVPAEPIEHRAPRRNVDDVIEPARS